MKLKEFEKRLTMTMISKMKLYPTVDLLFHEVPIPFRRHEGFLKIDTRTVCYSKIFQVTKAIQTIPRGK